MKSLILKFMVVNSMKCISVPVSQEAMISLRHGYSLRITFILMKMSLSVANQTGQRLPHLKGGSYVLARNPSQRIRCSLPG